MCPSRAEDHSVQQEALAPSDSVTGYRLPAVLEHVSTWPKSMPPGVIRLEPNLWQSLPRFKSVVLLQQAAQRDENLPVSEPM